MDRQTDFWSFPHLSPVVTTDDNQLISPLNSCIIFAREKKKRKKKGMLTLFLYPPLQECCLDAAYFFLNNLLQKVVFVVPKEPETAQTQRCRPKQKAILQCRAQSSIASWGQQAFPGCLTEGRAPDIPPTSQERCGITAIELLGGNGSVSSSFLRSRN